MPRSSRTKILSCWPMAIFLVAVPVQATPVYSLFYFLTSAPNTCTAQDVEGHAVEFHSHAAGLCGDRFRYALRKGEEAYPRDNEWYILDPVSGYLEIMNEVQEDPVSGAVIKNRVFRDAVKGEKGYPWMPASFSKTQGKSWLVNLSVEEWGDAAGSPACAPTRQLNAAPFTSVDSVEALGIWPRWLWDKRARSLDRNAKHDIDVILRSTRWGSNPEVLETYYYARWQNPATGQWEGIGLIKHERFENGVLKNRVGAPYLVDCVGLASCPTCPP